VLDEADRLLDQSLIQDVLDINAQLPEKK